MEPIVSEKSVPFILRDYEILCKIHKVERNDFFEDYKFIAKNTTGRQQIKSYFNPKFTELLGFGIYKNNFYIVMERLGVNLRTVLLNMKHNRLNEKTVATIGLEILSSLEVLHDNGFVHLNISPSNLMFSQDGKSIYLIDFSLAKKYLSFRTGNHYEMQKNQSPLGTAQFMSCNCHDGLSLTRRDDIESFVYLLCYLKLGKLPWTAYGNNLDSVRNSKATFSVKFFNLPECFELILSDAKKLKYEEIPRYNYYRQLLKDFLKDENVREQKFEVKVDPLSKQLRLQTTDEKVFSEINTVTNIVRSTKTADSIKKLKPKPIRKTYIHLETNKIFDNIDWSKVEEEEEVEKRIQKRIRKSPEEIARTNRLPFSKVADSEVLDVTDQVFRILDQGETERLMKRRVVTKAKVEVELKETLSEEKSDPKRVSFSSIYRKRGALQSSQDLVTNLQMTSSFKNMSNLMAKSGTRNNFNNTYSLKLKHFIRIRDFSCYYGYKILGKLGHGSFSEVHLVKNLKLNEERAMKIIKRDNPIAKKEISVLRELSHPNIVETYEIFEDDKNYYIVGEFLRGRELFEHISLRKVFPEERATFIIFQTLYALKYLHARNVIHRDIKPENILFCDTKKLELKLIDFGSSTKVEYVSKICSEFQGTSYYIAPEIFAKKYNEKCDIWSVGVVFYIIIVGYAPFNGRNNNEIFNNITQNSVHFERDDWKMINPKVIDLIKKMLLKNPDKRISAADALNHPIFETYKNLKSVKKKTLTKLLNFSEVSEFKKTLLFILVTLIDVSIEKNKFKKEFAKFDRDVQGELSLEVFSAVLTEQGITDEIEIVMV